MNAMIPPWTPPAAEILTYDRVGKALLSFLNIPSLLAWQSVCRLTRISVDRYKTDAYCLGEYLRPIFSRDNAWAAFRQWQLECEFIVAGQLAIGFFERLPIPPRADLDIYIHQKHKADIRSRCLDMGYKPNTFSIPSILHLPSAGVSALVDEFVSDDCPGKTIRVMACENGPMEAVMKMSCTIYMTFITYQAAFCLFGKATMVEKRGIITCPYAKYRPDFTFRFIGSGWEVMSSVSPSEFQGIERSSLRSGGRFVGDADCWTIRFDRDERSLMEANAWTVDYDDKEREMEIVYDILSIPVFKHSYVVRDTRTVDILTRLFRPNYHSSPNGEMGHLDAKLRDLVQLLFAN